MSKLFKLFMYSGNFVGLGSLFYQSVNSQGVVNSREINTSIDGEQWGVTIFSHIHNVCHICMS